MSTNSKKAENMFINLLELVGYKNLQPDYNKEQIIALINKTYPNALDYCVQQRAKQKLQTKWNIIPINLIIDWVCGVDAIISPDGNTKWGFDVTTDASKISKKLNKLREFDKLWKILGITKVGVILLEIPNEFEGITLLTEEDKERLVNSFLEDVIYAMDDQTSEVRTHFFSF